MHTHRLVVLAAVVAALACSRDTATPQRWPLQASEVPACGSLPDDSSGEREPEIFGTLKNFGDSGEFLVTLTPRTMQDDSAQPAGWDSVIQMDSSSGYKWGWWGVRESGWSDGPCKCRSTTEYNGIGGGRVERHCVNAGRFVLRIQRDNDSVLLEQPIDFVPYPVEAPRGGSPAVRVDASDDGAQAQEFSGSGNDVADLHLNLDRYVGNRSVKLVINRSSSPGSAWNPDTVVLGRDYHIPVNYWLTMDAFPTEPADNYSLVRYFWRGFSVPWYATGYADINAEGTEIARARRFTEQGWFSPGVRVLQPDGTETSGDFRLFVEPQLVASASFVPSNPHAGDSVTFSAQAVEGGQYKWEFSDGPVVGWTTSSSTARTFPGGTFSVKLSVRRIDDPIFFDDTTMSFAVQPPLSASFRIEPDPVRPNVQCSWSVWTIGGTPPYSYRWYRNGELLGRKFSADSISINTGYSDFWMRVRISDAAQQVATVWDSTFVRVTGSSGPDCNY